MKFAPPLLCAVSIVSLAAAAAMAQLTGSAIDLDHPAIGYRIVPRQDRAAELNRRLERCEVRQVRMTNLLTRFGWLTRIAEGNPQAESGLRGSAAELVDYLLFVDEAPLDRVRGSSGFAERFARRGPRDGQGRSLRDLDLGSRLMRYPCSYLIYSDVFDALPAIGRELIYRRMKDVLSGADPAPRYARLTAGDRQAIVEILRETKTNLPAWF